MKLNFIGLSKYIETVNETTRARGHASLENFTQNNLKYHG